MPFCARRFVVGCIWSSIGLWLGWFVGRKFSRCDGLDWVGLGESFRALGWIGLTKLDTRTTLRYRHSRLAFGHRSREPQYQ